MQSIEKQVETKSSTGFEEVDMATRSSETNNQSSFNISALHLPRIAITLFLIGSGISALARSALAEGFDRSVFGRVYNICHEEFGENVVQRYLFPDERKNDKYNQFKKFTSVTSDLRKLLTDKKGKTFLLLGSSTCPPCSLAQQWWTSVYLGEFKPVYLTTQDDDDIGSQLAKNFDEIETLLKIQFKSGKLPVGILIENGKPIRIVHELCDVTAGKDGIAVFLNQRKEAAKAQSDEKPKEPELKLMPWTPKNPNPNLKPWKPKSKIEKQKPKS